MLHFRAAPSPAEQASGIIPATDAHIAGMLAAQEYCSLAAKLETGVPVTDIERGGFLVHLLTDVDFKEIVTNPDVISRVHLDPAGEVDAYAICYPLPVWNEENPSWLGSIAFHEGVAPGPKAEETILFRYVATGPNAAAGVGIGMTSTLVESYGRQGYKAVYGETLRSPYYNRPANLIHSRRIGMENAGRILEPRDGQTFDWTVYRKTFAD